MINTTMDDSGLSQELYETFTAFKHILQSMDKPGKSSETLMTFKSSRLLPHASSKAPLKRGSMGGWEHLSSSCVSDAYLSQHHTLYSLHHMIV